MNFNGMKKFLPADTELAAALSARLCFNDARKAELFDMLLEKQCDKDGCTIDQLLRSDTKYFHLPESIATRSASGEDVPPSSIVAVCALAGVSMLNVDVAALTTGVEKLANTAPADVRKSRTYLPSHQ